MTDAYIVIIDDHAITLPYKSALELVNLKVEIALNGHRGIELVRRYNPDVVLLDARMPGMDGLEVLRRLQADNRTAHIPVIMISVDEDPVYISQVRAAGAVDYVVKPVDADDIRQRVLKLVANRKQAPVAPPRKHRPATEPRVGALYRQPPEQIMPPLAAYPRSDWPAMLEAVLVQGSERQRGRAVIALAAWQREENVPYNRTNGQHTFWKHLRHSLASSHIVDAERRWARLTPVARALIAPPAQMVARLAACIEDPWWECRGWTLRILHTDDEPIAVDLAMRALGDNSGEVRTMAAQVLARRGKSQHVLRLAQALGDAEPGVRENAAMALANIGDELAVEALVEVLHKSRQGAAEAAANGLAHVASDEAVSALIYAVRHRHEPDLLRQIAHALGKIKCPRCLTQLEHLSLHPDDSVNTVARLYLR